MIGRLLASAALTVVLGGTAMAQMAAPPPSNPPAPSSSAPSSSVTGGSAGGGAMGAPMRLNQQASKPNAGLSTNRQTAQGALPATPRLNAADQLNACEAKPINERQACINAATRM